MSQNIESELIELTQKLLGSIGAKNWAEYEQLCDSSLTCFEPEARGHLVEGLEFHKYYFGLGSAAGNRNTTLCSPHVRLMGDNAAVVSYVRLIQHLDASGQAQTSKFEETRVWQKKNGRWVHVHFHRS